MQKPAHAKMLILCALVGRVVPRKSGCDPTVAAPSFFNMLKWKSDELCVHARELKWRGLISCRRNVFMVWGKLIGRVQQQLIVCIVTLEPTYSFQQLMGVLDQVRAILRLGGPTAGTRFLEQDMQNIFWEIPNLEAMECVRWVISLVHPNREPDASMFAVCKRGLKHLDWVGTRSSSLSCISGAEVLCYIAFGLFDDGLFCCGPFVLPQGDKGVPIGGFLSAQLSELWALWREWRFVFRPACVSACAVWAAILQPFSHAEYPDTPPPSLSLVGDSDFTLSPHVASTMLCRRSIMLHP